MERRNFIRICGYSAIGIPFGAALLQSCDVLYYASSTLEARRIIVAQSEFIKEKGGKQLSRDFVLLKKEGLGFPICLYRTNKDGYVASLLQCTHNGCELNVGGGMYSCPCHGSEFSTSGKVLEGPADQDLTTFKTESDHENIYIYLS